MFPGFTLFGKFISSYVLCTVAGIFTACPLAIARCKKRGGDDISMIFVLLFGGVGVLAGMHLLYGITNIAYWGEIFKAKDFIDFCKRVGVVFGGGVFYGGLIGGLVAGGISIKVQKLDAALYCDCAAFAIPLFHMFGRIGCFLGGCCYGKESEYGVMFTNSLVESANGVTRVPVQLYEVGRVEGATAWESFWYITFPMLGRVTLLVVFYTMVELFVENSELVDAALQDMRWHTIYDSTSAQLWIYFICVGIIIGIVMFLYNKLLLKRWS